MSWLDNYRQASYKNIDFYVPSHSLTGGKRAKVWEYPFKSAPYTQSMGNKAKRFDIEGYLIGDNYMSVRDELIAELEKDGSGKLVHPYYGTFEIVVLDWSFRENNRETRMVRFNLQCVQAGELSFPITKEDTVTSTALQKKTAYDRLIDAFAIAYDIASVPHSIASNTLLTVDKALDVLDAAKTTVSAVASFKQTIKDLKGRAIALTYDARELVENITDLVQFGTNLEGDEVLVTVETSEENFDNMRVIMDFTPETILKEDLYSPDNFFAWMFRLAGTISACTLLTIMEYDSYESSIEFRNIAINRLDDFLENIEDDDLYNELYSLRTKVIKDLEVRAQQLPRLSELILTQDTPAIVLSHSLYGTIANEDDILKRNDILDPAFIPAQVPLEVLVYE